MKKKEFKPPHALLKKKEKKLLRVSSVRPTDILTERRTRKRAEKQDGRNKRKCEEGPKEKDGKSIKTRPGVVVAADKEVKKRSFYFLLIGRCLDDFSRSETKADEARATKKDNDEHGHLKKTKKKLLVEGKMSTTARTPPPPRNKPRQLTKEIGNAFKNQGRILMTAEVNKRTLHQSISNYSLSWCKFGENFPFRLSSISNTPCPTSVKKNHPTSSLSSSALRFLLLLADLFLSFCLSPTPQHNSVHSLTRFTPRQKTVGL